MKKRLLVAVLIVAGLMCSGGTLARAGDSAGSHYRDHNKKVKVIWRGTCVLYSNGEVRCQGYPPGTA